MSLGIKLELQEETALTTTVTSGSNETGSVSEILVTNVDLITDDNLKKTGADFSAPVFLVCCNTAY